MKTIKLNTLALLLILSFASVTSLISQSTVFSWANAAGGTGDEVAESVVTDASGNIYSVGSFASIVDFDSGPGTSTLVSAGSSDIFILKQNSSGGLLWVKQVGSSGADIANSVALDPTGNILITGSFNGIVDFNPGTAVSNQTAVVGADAFVLKLDQNGNYLWAGAFGGNSNDIGEAICTNTLGEVYVSGFFSSMVDFDPGFLSTLVTPVGGDDIYVLKLNANGTFAWVRTMGGTATDRGLSVASGTAGVRVTGYFQGTADFDPSSTATFTLNSNGSNDAFVCALSHAGVFQWAYQMGGTGADNGIDIAINAQEQILLTGSFNGVADFDPTPTTSTLQSNGSTDVFVAKYGNGTGLLWVKSFGASFADRPVALALDASSNVYTTGVFRSTVNFGPSYTVTANGSGDNVFVHKLSTAGVIDWVKTFGGDAGSAIAPFNLAVDNSNGVITVGEFDGTIDFNTEAGTYSLSSTNTNTDLYVHKLAICTPPPPPTITTSSANLNICNGQSASLTVSGSGLLTWYSTLTSTTALANGPLYNTPILSTGPYSYYVEASTCTLSTSRTLITVVVSNCTSILENSSTLSSALAYPNPSGGIFTIDAPYPMQIGVVNVLGKKILEQNVYSGKNQIDLTNYEKGIYFLTLESSHEKTIIKLIKD